MQGVVGHCCCSHELLDPDHSGKNFEWMGYTSQDEIDCVIIIVVREKKNGNYVYYIIYIYI